MAPTIRDIAERAGVSQTAVSIALGRPGRISAKTRERIQKIAAELGYRPNLLVHGIRTGQTMLIGVLVRVDAWFNSKIFLGAHDVLTNAKYATVVIAPTPDIGELEQLHALLDRRVDGVLIIPFHEAMWEEHLNEVIDRNIPIVSLDIEVQGLASTIDYIGTDDIAGGRLAAEHLLRLGHRSALIVNRGTAKQPPYLRYKSFEHTFMESGGTCTVVTLPWVPNPEAERKVYEVLRQTDRPTCVFATYDWLANWVYQAAQELGLHIPHDLSVVGFADEPVADFFVPGLTTFRQDPVQIGRRGAEVLLQRIKGEGGKQQIRELHIPELLERGSACKPPGKAGG